MNERDGEAEGPQPEPRAPTWSAYEPSESVSDGPVPAASAEVLGDFKRRPPPPVPRQGSRMAGLVVGVVALAVVGAGAGAVGLFSGGGAGGGVFSAPKVLTVDGYEAMVDELEDETGGTEVFRAILYPGYAVLDVPADQSSRREQSYRYDGDVEKLELKSTSDSDRLDLSTIDPAVFLRLIPKAEALVEDPETSYVIIEHTAESDYYFMVYANNDYGEGAYIRADLRGKVITRQKFGG